MHLGNGKGNSDNYLLTASEVFTGRSQTENLQGGGLRFSRKDQTFEVNNLFIIWLFALFLQAPNRPVGFTGEKCPTIEQSERA